MALFVLIGHDGPEGARLRDANREGHVAHLEGLNSAGRLFFAGPLRNDANDASIGAIIIIEADDATSAKATFEQDPFVSSGVFESWSVHPFKKVYPKDT